MKKDLTPLKIKALKELRALKQVCTPAEWGKLLVSVDEIDPNNIETCIYGKMTGDCFSKRAGNLIRKCAVAPFYDDINKNANITQVLRRGEVKHSFTALEKYLYSNKRAVIAEIKRMK